MKFNLKTIGIMMDYYNPETLEETDNVYNKWFEGFEKELRKMMSKNRESDWNDSYNWGQFVILKEILSE